MDSVRILAIDQGTSATKTVLFDGQGRILRKAQAALASHFPQAGFVEQEPEEIYRSVLAAVRECLEGFRGRLTACGISNQRETFLLWDASGKPLGRAVVWQCKRSIGVCERLKAAGLQEEISRRTGLILDPYFSGTKLIWLLDNDAEIRDAVSRGRACFGTVDTWLLYRLTGGRQYRTDYTNACRTLFFNLEGLGWDDLLLRELGLEGLRLPEVHPSSHSYGETDFEGLLPRPVPITALIGDSHAAAFGEGCFSSGMAKATLGTGSSILLDTEGRRASSRHGMVSTICWSTSDRVDYALEGIIVTAGATIKWLRDQLGLIADSGESEALARAVPDNGGVHLVPAFSGLGAPHWKMEARGAILNLTFASTRNHVVRAALESIPFQIKDVIAAMEQDSGLPLRELRVDGGASANGFVVQLLADLLGTPVVNPGIEEVSALGAGLLAGLQAGVYRSLEELSRLEGVQGRRRVYPPGAGGPAAQEAYRGWQQSVRRVY
jgi:glycerol kinase